MYVADFEDENIEAIIGNLHCKRGDFLMVWGAEKDAERISFWLKKIEEKYAIHIVGAFFPKLIVGNVIYDKGLIINELKIKKIIFINGKESAGNWLKVLPKELKKMNRTQKKPLIFVLSSGDVPMISKDLKDLFTTIGGANAYLGARASSLFLKKKGMQTGTIICLLENKIAKTCQHNAKAWAGPLVITKSEENVIKEFNWKNAFDVYSQFLENQLDKPLLPIPRLFEEIAKKYPIGIYDSDCEEEILRTPISVNERLEIVCNGEVSNNVVVNLMKMDAAGFEKRVEMNFKKIFEAAPKSKKYFWTIESVWREKITEAIDFQEEIDILQKQLSQYDEALQQEGVVALGQITTNQNDCLTLFNQTIITGLLYE